MLSLSGVGSTTEAIEVEARARSIGIFLDYVSCSTTAEVSLPWLRASVCFEVLDVARKFLCTALEARILASVDVAKLRPGQYWHLLA